MVIYTASDCPPCNCWATYLVYDQRRFWHLFLSICCVVFLNALCPTTNCNRLALFGLVLFKVLFSITLTLLMEQKHLAGCCFMVGDTAGQSDPRQWSAECETMLNQGWSSDGPRQVRGLPKPNILDLSHLKWTNSSWIGSCLISYTNTCSDHKSKHLFALFP